MEEGLDHKTAKCKLLLIIFIINFMVFDMYSGLVIVCHVTNTPFSKPQRLEMIRYLRNVQNKDGGWGL